MVEYKSSRDVETFSKFLENGGTLPEEPPVSEVRGQPPTQGCPQPLLGEGMDPAGWGQGQGQAGTVCPSVPHCCLLQVTKAPGNSTGKEGPSTPQTDESRDEL